MQKAVLEKNFEQERKAMRLQVSELEKKLEEARQDIAVMDSNFAVKDMEITTLQNNLKELEELREMKEVMILIIYLIHQYVAKKYSLHYRLL